MGRCEREKRWGWDSLAGGGPSTLLTAVAVLRKEAGGRPWIKLDLDLRTGDQKEQMAASLLQNKVWPLRASDCL